MIFVEYLSKCTKESRESLPKNVVVFCVLRDFRVSIPNQNPVKKYK